MENIKSIAIIGAGALGTMYMDSISKIENIESYFCCNEDRLFKLSNKKIFINNINLKYNVKTFSSIKEPPDLVLICVKNYHIDSLVNDLKLICNKDTIVISVLNGVRSESKLKQFLPDSTILHSIVLGMDAVMKSNHLTFTKKGKFLIGSISQEEDIYIKKVTEFFSHCKLDYEVSEDILKEIWYKWMINIGVNQVSAVTGSTYELFQKDKNIQGIMEDAMKETIKIGQQEGINIDNTAIDQWYKVLMSLGTNGKTSMLQDIEACRKTEVEYFSGDLIKLAVKYGVDVPVNKTLYRIIKTKELLY